MNIQQPQKFNVIRPTILVILDGWGIAPAWGGNAISMAQTPNFDKCWAGYVRTTLAASGEAVGLPGDEMGNSEVGHLNIGAGRVVKQDISLISSAIQNGTFFTNPILLQAMRNARQNNVGLHLMGLVSDGGVHSHINHLYALLQLAKQQGLKQVFIHAFTDGRDTDPMSALQFISRLDQKTKELGIGRIASVSGRYFAMDRDNRWDRTRLAYQAIAEGRGEISDSALKAISQSYAIGKLDEFISPVVITQNGQAIGTIKNKDSVIFFNFRADRARQITQALVRKNFNGFQREVVFPNLFFVSMVPYIQEDWGLSIRAAFAPKNIRNTLAEVISKNNLKQVHVAETEKYAHVTYFFNGAMEKPFPGEDRKIIPSPRVRTYDQKPEMSAETVKNFVISKMGNYDFILANFANCDMVGHTGNMPASISAVQEVDKCLGEIIAATEKIKGLTIVTADHGNVEEMISKTGSADTEHSTSNVPFILIDGGRKFQALHQGILADIAPTILEIWGVPKPREMTGKSLFGSSTNDHLDYNV
jgi:2,3-bisphosphoglycerate-independent phosphoglycerate mutase